MANAPPVTRPPESVLSDELIDAVYRAIGQHYATYPFPGNERDLRSKAADALSFLDGSRGVDPSMATLWRDVVKELLKDEKSVSPNDLPSALRSFERLELLRRQKFEEDERRTVARILRKLQKDAEQHSSDPDPAIRAVEVIKAVEAVDKLHLKLERRCEHALLISRKLCITIALKRGATAAQAHALMNDLYPLDSGGRPSVAMELRHFEIDTRADLVRWIPKLRGGLDEAAEKKASQLWVHRHLVFHGAPADLSNRSSAETEQVVIALAPASRSWAYVSDKIRKYLRDLATFYEKLGQLLEHDYGKGGSYFDSALVQIAKFENFVEEAIETED
ncbi:hypothetical protein DFJ74DRAFT_93547 [Hyaloraphidium curvatum]|nr:hypothetical protein DFJ74DRAFT_93547 [Hyaloraphidium curvatum]